LSQTISGVIDQLVHIEHGICQLIGRDLVLVANYYIGNIGGVKDGQHLVEDIAVASSVLSGDGDAVLVSRIKVRDDLGDGSFTSFTSMLMPPNNFLGGNNFGPWIDHWGFSWCFGWFNDYRGFSFFDNWGSSLFHCGHRGRLGASTEYQCCNHHDCK